MPPANRSRTISNVPPLPKVSKFIMLYLFQLQLSLGRDLDDILSTLNSERDSDKQIEITAYDLAIFLSFHHFLARRFIHNDTYQCVRRKQIELMPFGRDKIFNIEKVALAYGFFNITYQDSINQIPGTETYQINTNGNYSFNFDLFNQYVEDGEKLMNQIPEIVEEHPSLNQEGSVQNQEIAVPDSEGVAPKTRRGGVLKTGGGPPKTRRHSRNSRNRIDIFSKENNNRTGSGVGVLEKVSEKQKQNKPPMKQNQELSRERLKRSRTRSRPPADASEIGQFKMPNEKKLSPEEQKNYDRRLLDIIGHI